MTRGQLEAIALTSPHTAGRYSQMRRVYAMEDYLFVGGDRMSAAQAARRIGRSERTVTRLRAALRDAR